MPNVQETLTALQFYFTQVANLRRDLAELLESPLPKAQKDEIQADMEAQIKSWEKRKEKALSLLVAFPPHHLRHFPKMDDFYQVAPYEKSVFIMTKFPNGQTEKDQQLSRVIKATQDAVSAWGYKPRIASEKKYHPGLWDNVETYLFGCMRGIAIVESKHTHELNPNVTMEWGWMRGMGKDVLYLVEESFQLARADLSGLLQDPFQWDVPEPGIEKAVKAWLGS